MTFRHLVEQSTRTAFTAGAPICVQVPQSLICRMFQGEVPVKKVQQVAPRRSARVSTLQMRVLPHLLERLQTDVTYFVDRDPKHFQRILNYMRDGTCVLPQSVQDREELLAEARYYEVHCPVPLACVRQLHRQPRE